MTLIASKAVYKTDGKTVDYYDSYLDENGLIATVSNQYEVVQAQVSNLKLWLGECDYDNSNGVNYLFIFNKPDITTDEVNFFIQQASFKVNDTLDATTLQNYGIKEINSITYNLDKTKGSLGIVIKETLNNGTELEVVT